MQNKKPSMGGVWIFSETPQSNLCPPLTYFVKNLLSLLMNLSLIEVKMTSPPFAQE